MPSPHSYSLRRRAKQRRLTARDIMSDDPICVAAETSVSECAKLMRAHDIGALPVVGAYRDVVGIVTERDLYRAGAGDRPAARRWIELLGAPAAAAGVLSEAAGRRAKDVMTSRVICVRPEMPIEEIAKVLDEWKIKCVPVMQDGRIVGIVSRGDVIRTLINRNRQVTGLTATDNAIRDSVVSQVEQLTWLSGGGGVEVSVEDGNVVLYGFASTPEEIVAIEYMAESIPGVRCVENYLRVGQNTAYHN
jgi:CBS domain-containing protein